MNAVADDLVGTAGQDRADVDENRTRLTPSGVLLTAVWFGLAAGLLELSVLGVRVWAFEQGFFLRSEHFLWTVPLSDLVIYGSVGLALAFWLWAGRPLTARWIVGILLFVSCMSQLLMVRGLNLLTCALLSWGIALRTAGWVEARLSRSRRLVPVGALVFSIFLIGLAGASLFWKTHARRRGGDQRAESSRPALNVLLIVLDTVRADHLSLYGYTRDTTPNLRRLANQGVRFERARSTAPWTLPSHASMFTGRWPHELDVERLGRLDTTYTTLSEFLGAQGYATAGFVANPLLYGSKSGLARGFDAYLDYPVNVADVLRASSLGWLLGRVAGRIGGELRWCFTSDLAGTVSLDFTRKHATAINGEFLDWLSKNGERPFFAFLNYFDAHDPYLTPRGPTIKCATVPTSRSDFAMLRDWQRLDKDALSPKDIQLARDAYDNCIASLDHDVGRLIDELRARGLLEKTLLILTSDHGEQFGEHGTFGHGLSLYEPEVHVPMLIISPGRVPPGRVVSEAVSLRDVPATVVDFLGLNKGSPFPGISLAATWRERPAPGSSSSLAPLSELDARIEDVPVPRNAPAFAGPLRAILSDGNVYIHQGSGAEELYDLDSDATESHNLSGKEAAGPILDRCRRILDQLIPFTRPTFDTRTELR
jgi:arylsulfatase A-like enzyme